MYHHNNAALRRGSLPLGTREVVKLIAVAPDGSSVSIVISSLESVRNVPVSSLAEQSLQKLRMPLEALLSGIFLSGQLRH